MVVGSFMCSYMYAFVIAATPLYKTPGAPIDERVRDLVGRMNLEEKANQLVIPFGAKFPADYIKAGYNTSGLGGTYPLPGMLIVVCLLESMRHACQVVGMIIAVCLFESI